MRAEQTSVVAQRQAPLRVRFPEHPSEALTVKHTRTRGAGADPFHGRVEAVGFDGIGWDFGIDAKVGGYDDLPNPGHLLCCALTACLDSTIRMLADVLGIELLHLHVDVVGQVDVRGCLALEEGVRSGFERIECRVDLETDPAVDPRRKELLMARAQQLCVTLDTIRHGVPVEVSLTRA